MPLKLIDEIKDHLHLIVVDLGRADSSAMEALEVADEYGEREIRARLVSLMGVIRQAQLLAMVLREDYCR